MKHQCGKKAIAAVLCALLLAGCGPAATSPAFSGGTSSQAAASPAESSSSSAAPSSGAAIAPSEYPPDSAEEQPLSIEEEKMLFFPFWNDSDFGNLVNVPCGEDVDQYQQDFYLIASAYFRNRDLSPGRSAPYDTASVPYYPVEDFVGTLQAMFGDGPDYVSYLPNDPGPEEGTLYIADGYDYGYRYAALDLSSLTLQENELCVSAALQWREPGYREDRGTLTYRFLVRPEDPYCRYQLISLDGEDVVLD